MESKDIAQKNVPKSSSTSELESVDTRKKHNPFSSDNEADPESLAEDDEPKQQGNKKPPSIASTSERQIANENLPPHPLGQDPPRKREVRERSRAGEMIVVRGRDDVRVYGPGDVIPQEDQPAIYAWRLNKALEEHAAERAAREKRRQMLDMPSPELPDEAAEESSPNHAEGQEKEREESTGT